MEWVETTGRTVEEARDAALEQLGVAEEDAEILVLEEPRPGLFGRMRGEARVRARVRPAPVRPKEDRRDRRRRRQGSDKAATGADRPDRDSGGGRDSGAVATAVEAGETEEDAGTGSGRTRRSGSRAGNGSTGGEGRGSGQSRGRRRGGGSASAGAAGTAQSDEGGPDGGVPEQGEWEEGVGEEDVPLEEQGAEASAFLAGLVDRLGLDAEVSSEVLDEDNVEVRVDGEDLGILIGPRGNTLAAVQELTRTVIQRRLGAHNGRLLVDVSGYRQKRRVALERFTREVADQVKASGQRRVLEPMSPADRKVVHDTVNTIDGLSTTSEGEEPRRRVVILPEA